MRFLLFMLACVCGFSQDPVDVALYSPLSSNQIYALSPKLWLMGDVGVFSNGTDVPVNGFQVQTWNDQSGNGYNVVQPTLGARPRYRVGTLNGYSGVDFGNTSVECMSNLTFGKFPCPFTVAGVYDVSNSPGAAMGIFNGINVAYPRLDCPITGGGNALSLYDVAITRQLEPLAYHCFSGVVLSNVYPSLLNLLLFVNGKRAATSTNSAPSTNLWDGLIIGERDLGASGTRWRGRIFELLIFQGALNEYNRAGIELYLKRKYALPAPF